jgi:ubiquinone biosynthesis protein UbiJ
MIDKLNALLAPALMERAVLAINHVLSSEPQASERLASHKGKLLRVMLDNWPGLLPPPPLLGFRVTPAGMVEWVSEDMAADLRVRIDAGNPAALALRLAAGEQPAVEIEGDAQLATDVDWLMKNLRWDAEADLERLFGAGPAHELYRLGSWFAKGLRAAIARATAMAGPLRAR